MYLNSPQKRRNCRIIANRLSASVRASCVCVRARMFPSKTCNTGRCHLVASAGGRAKFEKIENEKKRSEDHAKEERKRVFLEKRAGKKMAEQRAAARASRASLGVASSPFATSAASSAPFKPSHRRLLCTAVVNTVYPITSKWTVYFYFYLIASRLHLLFYLRVNIK